MTTDIDAAERRANAATRGPWRNGEDGLAKYEVHLSAFLPVLELSAGDQGEANAEFIARARTDVPKMAAEIRELRAEWDRLVKERAAMLAVVRTAEEGAQGGRRGDNQVVGGAGEALIAAVDALPNMQEPCDICSSTGSGCPECRNDGLTTRGAVPAGQ